MSYYNFPNLWNIRGISAVCRDTADGSGTDTVLSDGQWGPARSEPYVPANPFTRLKLRLTLAWLVFVGRYDALDWMQ